MLVEIKRISHEGDEVRLVVRCCKPQRKEVPWSNGREELDRNNKLFEVHAEEHRRDMAEFSKRVTKLHLGIAQLIQDGEE